MTRAGRDVALFLEEGIELLTFYRQLLLHLGSSGSARVTAMFANASTSLKEPRNLRKLVEDIDALDWCSATSEGSAISTRACSRRTREEAQLHRVDSAILASAFRGELLDRDSTDESALVEARA